MAYGYLNGLKWADITREERYFCSHLYHSLLDREKLKTFLCLLKDVNKPGEEIPKNALGEIDIDTEWEPGFEVCFYRDLLLKYGISVKKNDAEIEYKEKMIKRTFDLCLFSKDAIIIIEAKCLSNLNVSQYEDFRLDSNFILSTYAYLNSKRGPENQIESPKIYTVFLAPSKYYKSVSFRKVKGIGTRIIEDFKNSKIIGFDKFISWEQIAQLESNPLTKAIFEKANV